ncbi:MAG: acyltransferase family protein [Bryobacteraceae bacterium]
MEPLTHTSSLQSASSVAVSPQRPRLYFVDNLRWTMIILVVSMHAAVTYSHVGRWYYMEGPRPGMPVFLTFATYQAFLQAFFMGFLFFLAGYFVPGAYDKKGSAKFLRDRFIRLGIPTLLYMFVIGPFTEYYVAHTWTSTRPTSFGGEIVKHILNGQFLNGTGPLWFCAALLFFCFVYALFRQFTPASSRFTLATALPGNRGIMAFIALLALATFLVRIPEPMGKAVYNMQLCFFSQYVLMFCAGILAYRTGFLTRLPYSFGIRWLWFGLAGGFVLWVAVLALGGAFEGKIDSYNGGWHWQSAGFAIWESVVCAGVSLGLTVLYREKFNTQGPVSKILTDNAFAVYVLHPPVLIAISHALQPFEAPPLVKFVVLTILAFSATLALSALVVRRIPGLKTVLS